MQDRSRSSGLLIFHGNRLETLSEVLLEYVAQNPLPGLSPDLWVVQGAGMKAWLEAQAAQHPKLGISAATRILQPAAALWELQRMVLGHAQVPNELPLDESAMVWRIMAWLERMPNEPVWHPLQHHLARGPAALAMRHRFQLAQQIADVFDAYQTHRPDWLQAWLNQSLDANPPVPPRHCWQPRLWSELVQAARHQTGLKWVSRDQVFSAFLEALQAPQLTTQALPHRLILLGVSALPIVHIRALGALSHHMQVLVFALNPSEAYWGDAHRRTKRFVADLTAEPSTEDHPLLAAWGQQARDFLHCVDQADAHRDPRRELFEEPCPAAPGHASVLQKLQSDILANRHPRHRGSVAIPSDDSLVFCKSHGPLREVQALHDQVLSWLGDDPTLEPRDIVVMVSDLPTFVPLVRATWGALPNHDPRYVPFQIAQTHPEQALMLDCIEAGLQLLQSPMGLSHVLAWLEHPAVSHAFGLQADDLPQLSRWLNESGVRWGLDPNHAMNHGWPPALATQNLHTWQHGVQRLLLSHAMGDAPESATQSNFTVWQDLASVAGVGGVQADCLNGLIRCLDALRRFVTLTQTAQPAQDWVLVLGEWLSICHRPRNEAQEAVLDQLRNALSRWGQLCDACAHQSPLPLSVVAMHWLDAMRAAQTGTRLIGSGVVFTTAMPLQSVPFKRICMLGLNDGQFPRMRTPRDFDLMDEPGWGRTGDGSRHDDDRYLLLQALLSAREGIYFSWQGFQAQDGKALPASVLIQQLLEVLELTTGEAWPVHTLPMHAHGLAYFTNPNEQTSALNVNPAPQPRETQPKLWATYAKEWRAAREPLPPNHDTVSSKTGAPSDAAVSFESTQSEHTPPHRLRTQDLLTWLRNPIDAHVRHRLGIQWDEPLPAWPNAEPFEMPRLTQHRWIQEAAQAPALPQAWRWSGDLPTAGLGDWQWQQLDGQTQALRKHWQALTQHGQHLAHGIAFELRFEAPPAHGSSMNLGPEQTLALIEGRIDSVQRWQATQSTQMLTLISAANVLSRKASQSLFSNEGKKNAPRPILSRLIKAAVSHILACAQGQVVHTHLVGPDATLDWPPLPTTDAMALVKQWWTHYQLAWQSPMPVLCDLAGEWLTTLYSPALAKDDALNLAQERVLKRMDTQTQAASWDRKRYAIIERFLPDAPSALHAIELWAKPLYFPLIENLHVTIHAIGGERHRWMDGTLQPHSGQAPS